jgi:hypothetical protein
MMVAFVPEHVLEQEDGVVVAKAAVDQAIKAVRSEMTFEEDPTEEAETKIIGRTTIKPVEAYCVLSIR